MPWMVLLESLCNSATALAVGARFACAASGVDEPGAEPQHLGASRRLRRLRLLALWGVDRRPPVVDPSRAEATFSSEVVRSLPCRVVVVVDDGGLQFITARRKHSRH